MTIRKVSRDRKHGANGAKRSAATCENKPTMDKVVRRAVKILHGNAVEAVNREELQRMRERVEKLQSESDKAHELAVRNVTSLIGEHIVRACDKLGEDIAGYAELDNVGEAMFNVADALLSLWRVRWELGMTDSDVTFKAKATEYVIEREAKRAEKANGSNGAAAPEASPSSPTRVARR